MRFSFLLSARVSMVEAMSKGELTRQRIIAEAAPLFNQRGYVGCSMQDVMDATGLEKGALYRHFASKEELAVEALRYALTNSIRTHVENLDEIKGSVNQLRHMIRHFLVSPSLLPGGCPLMNTAIDSDDGNPMLRQVAREEMQAWKGRIEAVVKKGIERGEIRRQVEPRRIANTMVATLEGALMVSRLEGTKSAMDDAQASLQVVLDGIAVRL
jgi:TetR/AcrR family transcriptional regulator, transcriptional repressor for nem operon